MPKVQTAFLLKVLEKRFQIKVSRLIPGLESSLKAGEALLLSLVLRQIAALRLQIKTFTASLKR